MRGAKASAEQRWGGESRRSDFVARTVAGVTGSLERALFSAELARLPGLLQGVDARAKVVAGGLLLITAGLSRHLEVLLALQFLTLLLARLSRLPLSDFVRRGWLGIPLFAAVVALPSLFLLPGRPLLVLIEGPPLRLGVTDNGLWSALLLVARVGCSVSLALLLISTTSWTALLGALRVVRVPGSFLVVLGMTYRYLFLFLRSANNLFLARASRTVGRSSGGEQRRWAAGAAGALMGRSLKLSGDLSMAMRARGFDGEMPTQRPTAMRDEDWLLVALGVILAGGLLLVDLRL